jgi:hypothetical protein
MIVGFHDQGTEDVFNGENTKAAKNASSHPPASDTSW